MFTLLYALHEGRKSIQDKLNACPDGATRTSLFFFLSLLNLLLIPQLLLLLRLFFLQKNLISCLPS
jgi:hypothetical protein